MSISARQNPAIPSSDPGNSFPDRRHAVLVVSVTTLAIATLFIAARLVSRIAIVRRTSWDDYCIILGWVLACGLSLSAAIGTSFGLGLRDANIPGKWLYPLRKCEYAFSVLYNPALMATKSSIIIFYLRLSRNTQSLLRIASWVTFAVINIAGLTLTFFNIFQCVPVSEVFAPAGKCIPLITLYLASVPVNVITDLAVLVLPIPVLTAVQLPRKQKMILIATFSLGVFVVATDIVRIYYLQQSSGGYLGPSKPDTSPLLGAEVDFAWYASESFLWSAVEVNLGIICACVPTMKPLISKILPALIDSRRGTLCFGSINKSNNSGTTAVSSPLPVETNGRSSNMSPTSPVPQGLTTTNTDDLLVSRDRVGSDATDTLDPLPSITAGATPNTEQRAMEFLTSPGMNPERIPRVSTALGRTEAEVYFGFFTIRTPRSMLRLSVKDSTKYCILITVLFFLCGFSHGLWNNLNNQISTISTNSTSRTLALYSLYYGAYFFGPITAGQYILRKASFKATFVTGLCIYGTGIFMFWPSAVLLSFAGFLVSTFVVGFGLSIIETATNPFLALCGPEYYGEIRLLVAQGFGGIGKLVGMLVAEKGLFQDVKDGPALLDIQWLYLAIALSSVVLALTLYYLPLPEATDDDLQLESEDGLPQLNHTVNAEPEHTFRIGNLRIVFVTLGLGFCALFLYSGVQQTNGLWLTTLLGTPIITLVKVKRGITPISYDIIANASLAFGRFICAAFCFFIPPRILLLCSFLGTLVFSILIFAVTGLNTNDMAALLIILFFFEGPIWPLIYAICLRGMGRRTKIAAAILTSATTGAVVIPWIYYAIMKEDGRSAQYSYCVLIAFVAVGTIFPLYLSFFSKARAQVDRGEKNCSGGLFG